MKVRVKTLEELEAGGAYYRNFRISKPGAYFMTSEMIKYLGCEINLYLDRMGFVGMIYKNLKLTGDLIWSSWMFEEIKMNRNGANEIKISNEGSNE